MGVSKGSPSPTIVHIRAPDFWNPHIDRYRYLDMAIDSDMAVSLNFRGP